MPMVNGFRLQYSFVPEGPFQGNIGYTAKDITLTFLIGGNSDETAHAVLTVYKGDVAIYMDMDNQVIYSNNKEVIENLHRQYQSR